MLTWTFCLLALLQLGVGDESCTHSAQLDLQIIVDSSASVGLEHFQTMMKKISSSLVDQFEIGKGKTRIALFKYSMNRVMKNEVPLNRFSNKKDLQKKIEGAKFEPGWTMTAMAMNKALASFKQHQRKEKNTARVCMVFTDGEATDRTKVPDASKAWADDGVTVFAIGIGSGVSHKGLKDIAGANERAFEVDNFEAISEMAKGLLKKVCKNVEKVQPTKAPKVAPTKPPKVPKEDLAEVDFSKGKISATSENSATHSAKMAFSPQTKGKHPWANKKSNKFPVVVWSKLPGKVTIAKFSFASRSDGYTFQSPTVFELVGSEDCERWKVIDKFSTKFTKKNEVKTWYIPKNKRKSFSCIGIKVHKVTKGPYAAIQNLKMWKEPAKPAAKPGAQSLPPPPPAPKIPGGYRKGSDGYYYKFHGERKNWNDAQNACKGEGGNLAIIFNQITRDVVRGFMADGWIGVSDQWQEGRWQTPTRGNIPYTSWSGGEPNNQGNEDCTMQHSNKKWNDMNCGSDQPFICQFKAGAGKRDEDENSERLLEALREESEKLEDMEQEEPKRNVEAEGELEEVVEKVREEVILEEVAEEARGEGMERETEEEVGEEAREEVMEEDVTEEAKEEGMKEGMEEEVAEEAREEVTEEEETDEDAREADEAVNDETEEEQREEGIETSEKEEEEKEELVDVEEKS